MKLTKQVNFKLCVLFVMGTVAFANAQIPEDKKLHFAAGNIAGAVGYTWSYKKHQDKKRAIVAGICTAFAAGVILGMHTSKSMKSCLKMGVCSAASCLMDSSTSKGVMNMDKCLNLGDQYGFRSLE